jgi:hypothetical protein
VLGVDINGTEIGLLAGDERILIAVSWRAHEGMPEWAIGYGMYGAFRARHLKRASRRSEVKKTVVVA